MLPAVRQVDRLIEDSRFIDNIANAIQVAQNESELATQFRSTVDLEEQMRGQLPALQVLMKDNAEIGQFEDVFNNIFQALQKQLTLVRNRNETRDKQDLLLGRALAAARSLGEATNPALIELTTHLYEETDGIRSQLQSHGKQHDVLIDRFDQLMSVDVEIMQQLTQVTSHVQRLLDALEGLPSNNTRAEAARTNEQININLRALARLIVAIQDKDFRATAGGYLRTIAGVTRGSEGVENIQRSIFDTSVQIEVLSGSVVKLRNTLNRLADNLRKSADQAVNRAVSDAKEAIYFARFVLMGIALFALLTAIWVIWRFVMSDVVARIDRLAQITRRLAAGDLEVAVDVPGKDELGEVVDAMRLFKENAIELKKSNADLEEFAYAASHDLKAPLRGIGNIAGWIKEDLGESLTDDTKKQLELMKNRIDRMGLLLDDLLQYSRAGRQKSEVTEIDLQEGLPELFDLVAGSEQMELLLTTTFPLMNTATAPLELVFRNLFSNSLKHRDEQSAKIEVSCYLEDAKYHFTVADDGPGIPQEYHQRVFGMFQTIKGRDEVEGSGVGLSMTKRHIESVGCRIWIEKQPSKQRGAAFHFTWPVEWPKALKKADVS